MAGVKGRWRILKTWLLFILLSCFCYFCTWHSAAFIRSHPKYPSSCSEWPQLTSWVFCHDTTGPGKEKKVCVWMLLWHSWHKCFQIFCYCAVWQVMQVHYSGRENGWLYTVQHWIWASCLNVLSLSTGSWVQLGAVNDDLVKQNFAQQGESGNF